MTNITTMTNTAPPHDAARAPARDAAHDLARNTLVARKAMIDSQLRTSGVNEEFVLARMMAVPRENFLPEGKAGLAYIDRSVVLGDGAHLASPLFYGKLLLEAAPLPSDRVLIVEGGTGYLAELMRPIAGDVTVVSAADAANGTLPDGMFSLILVDGAVEQLTDTLTAKLEDDGRVVSGLLLRGVTRLAFGRKILGQVSLLPVEDFGIPMLHAFDIPQGWVF